jgi:alpha-L-fucosidase
VPGSRALISSVRRHRVPAWWSDAKLGIFVHWTPSSVPAFAPVDSDMGELLARGDPRAMAWSPYVEWYENSLRFPESPVAKFHAATYPGREYRSFVADFESGLEGWDPDAWAVRFAATGARYVVLVAKHHDGYCLWPTDVANPHRPGFHSGRDIVGELADAVRRHHMRFGVYYSGGLDWTFNDHPIGSFSDLLAAQPRDDYAAYAEAQVRELIERYRPSVLWNDISWPAPVAQLARLLSDYYAAVPEGVVNDRFMPWSPLWRVAQSPPGRHLLDRYAARSARAERGIVPPKPPLFDVRTPEYTVFDAVQPTPWECVRGMDHSFGHNEMSEEKDFVTQRDLLWSLVDIAAKGGNLLLNVGPRGVDAQIAEAQVRRLDWLADFTAEVGQALVATRPWVHPSGRGIDGLDVRYTARDRTVFAFVRLAEAPLAAPGDPEVEPRPTVVLSEVRASGASTVATLDGRPLRAQTSPEGWRIEIDGPLSAERPTVLVLRDVEANRVTPV